MVALRATLLNFTRRRQTPGAAQARDLMRLVEQLRLAIPATLSALGIGYVAWDTQSQSRLLTSPETVVGFALFGVIGPLLTFLTLHWAMHAVIAMERAEQQRMRQNQQLLILNTLSEAVNQSLDVNAVLNQALRCILETLRLDAGDIRLLENGRLLLHAAQGVAPAFRTNEPCAHLGRCICGNVAQRGELMALNYFDRLQQFSNTPCAVERFSSVLSVPVRTADRVLGVLHVATRTPRTFEMTERALLTAIGYQIGIAVEKARLHEQVKQLNQALEDRVRQRTHELQLAQQDAAHKADALQRMLIEERRIEERTRTSIAHDLHDGVQQLLIGALYEMQAAHDALARDSQVATARISAAQELLQHIASEMRRTIYSLRPMLLDTHGLAPALRECVASFARVACVPCDFQCEGAVRRLRPETEVAAFRIVQEALNNIQQHAQASRCSVYLRFGLRELYVEVSDNGRGFDAAAIRAQARSHLGLLGMSERAASVDGTLDIFSEPGAGARIIFMAPMTPPADDVAGAPASGARAPASPAVHSHPALPVGRTVVEHEARS